MNPCNYHPSATSESVCNGCKLPVCADCRAEGNAFFCGPCLRRVSALGAAVDNIKATGVVKNQKATMLRAMPTSPSELNELASAGSATPATKCFLHFERTAVAACSACSQSFCGACLGETGLCSHCAKFLADADSDPQAAAEALLSEQPPEPVRQAPPRRGTGALTPPPGGMPAPPRGTGKLTPPPAGGAAPARGTGKLAPPPGGVPARGTGKLVMPPESPAPVAASGRKNALVIGLMVVAVLAFLLFLSVAAGNRSASAAWLA